MREQDREIQQSNTDGEEWGRTQDVSRTEGVRGRLLSAMSRDGNWVVVVSEVGVWSSA